MSGSEFVTVRHDGMLRDEEGEEAVLFLFDDDDTWIPRSLLGEWDDKTAEVKSWFAEKEGLTDYAE